MPCFVRLDRTLRFKVLLQIIATMLLILLLLLAAPARGEGGIEIKSFALEAVGKGYQISLDADITLNNTLEQALEKGIILYFVSKFTLIESRWYWLDEEVARSKRRIGLSYHALTRQYRLNDSRMMPQGFDTLQEALQTLGRQHNIPVEIKSTLKQGAEYVATLQVWLDISRLAKPFQLEWFSSKDWNLSSEKKEWRIKLPAPHKENL
ncbi:DUF4390 domain-containing protein [Nitrosomonas sp. Is37]|uniref:DUF4390 domain-containing protein n=1 Tax=Nitrosomonas sp. Is37 TaxID=3080535 RepID=UPI00294AC183|nr:DUF4390 domain-containing protein [Nitrosomonas sp. Is37]MDV6344370.1 DUF4390 domain-containing protein [Nitrosomonas sp. Is37]